jgi:uncharacterized membrane protein YeaQ/YmgE (transglycosylase-associated protein family)
MYMRTLSLVVGGAIVGELCLSDFIYSFHVIPTGTGAFLGAVVGAITALVIVLKE